MGLENGINLWAIWQELKPIAGPLIQAMVVLTVGVFTIKYQHQQSETARTKLFADIHDKRYRSLTGYLAALDKTSFDIGYLEKRDGRLLQNPNYKKNNAERYRLVQEVSWLFGPEVRAIAWDTFHLNSEINKMLWSKSGPEDPLTDKELEMSKRWRVKHRELSNAARPYLYMGDIRRPVDDARPDQFDGEALVKELK